MLKTLRQPEFRWPIVGDGLGGEYQWSASQWNLLRTLAEMRNQHSKSVLIRLYVSPDDKNSSHYIIKVRHPQLSLLLLFVHACNSHFHILQRNNRQSFRSFCVICPQFMAKRCKTTSVDMQEDKSLVSQSVTFFCFLLMQKLQDKQAHKPAENNLSSLLM